MHNNPQASRELKHMKNDLYNLKLKTKLVGSYLLISLVLLLLVGMTVFVLGTREISRLERENTSSYLQNKTNQVNTIFESMVELTDILLQNVNIQNLMRESFVDISAQYSEDLNGSMQLLSIASYNKDIAGVYLLGDNGGKYKSNYASLQTMDFRETDWYQEIISQDALVWFLPHRNSYVAKTDRELEYITLGCPYVDKAVGKNNGVVLVEIETQTLAEILTDSDEKIIMEVIDRQGNQIMSINGNGIYANPENYREMSQEIIQELGEQKEQEHQLVERQSPAYLMVGDTLWASSWMLLGSVERGTITSTVLHMAVIVLVIMALGILFTVMVSVFISRTVTNPLSSLMGKMKLVEQGNLDVSFPVRYQDEIGQLGKSFNRMISHIKTLMADVKESEKKLRNAEMKALQAQINPHFLYNSLDSIIWLLRLKKNEEAIVMLQALSKLFKITLSNGKEFISVGEEVEHIRSYLIIEKIRYSKKFDYEIHFDENAGQAKIPKLLLQPIVENSIYHGITKAKAKEQIIVDVKRVGDTVRLSVKDTGKGMDKEKLAELQKSILYAEKDNNSGSYGLRNINERIIIYYGEEYGISICSRLDHGTEVTIVIPYKE